MGRGRALPVGAVGTGRRADDDDTRVSEATVGRGAAGLPTKGQRTCGMAMATKVVVVAVVLEWAGMGEKEGRRRWLSGEMMWRTTTTRVGLSSAGG